MSIGFDPKNHQTSRQSLKVQELVVSGRDYDLFTTEVGEPIITEDPYLASAGSFAVLGASAVSNTGNSVLTGDLGISPGTSVTGFPPGTFSGSLHVADATAAQAQVDALAGYTALAALPGYVTILSALDGQTLTAGNYEFASGAATLATSAPGTLTFSGSATDVFVIKTASTYTSGAGGAATIALTGGALAKNIYWVIGSSATINISGGAHKGNIIAQASITATSGGASDVDGSLVALTGAVTLSAATTIDAVNGPTSTASIDLSILVREPVEKVFNAGLKDDSENTMREFDQANISIVDSESLTTDVPSDRGAIKLVQLAGTSMAADDVVVVKYSVLEHL